MLCLTPEEKDAIACFVELTFPSYHCKTLIFFHLLYSKCFILLFYIPGTMAESGFDSFGVCFCDIRTAGARFFPPHCLVAASILFIPQ